MHIIKAINVNLICNVHSFFHVNHTQHFTGDDDVYLIEKLQHVGYKIYLLTDQPIRHKYKMNSKQQ
jgi:hypothetical protein